MKILSKIIAALLMIAGLVLAGCGTTDKFAGSWYYYDKTNRQIVEMRIAKTEERKYTAQDFFHKYDYKDKLVKHTDLQDTVDLIYYWKPEKNDPNKLTLNDAGILQFDGWEGLTQIAVKDGVLYWDTIKYEKWNKEQFEANRQKIREQLKNYRPSGYDIHGTMTPQPLIKRVRNIIIDPPTIK